MKNKNTPAINWDEQPSPDAVWIVDIRTEGGVLIESGWYCLDVDLYIMAGTGRFWPKNKEDVAFTVYRREDCAVESLAEVEWNGEGLPPVGVECEIKYFHQDDHKWEKCYIVGETKDNKYLVINVYHDDSLHFAFKEKGSLEFRPLKTQQEKEREAFVDSVASLFGESDDMDIYGLAGVMFDLGYTAPKGEGDDS